MAAARSARPRPGAWPHPEGGQEHGGIVPQAEARQAPRIHRIDTGAILALLDRDDRWHARCRAAFVSLRVPLATSAAVLAEVFHLVGDHPREVRTAWGFLRSGAVSVLTIDDTDLPALEALMRRYADHPMDFADATLVHLAHRESLVTVFTIDHADFETYRIGGQRRFRVVPGR